MICTMDNEQGDFLMPPHGTTPYTVIGNKYIKVSSFESSKNSKENGGPYCTISDDETSSIGGRTGLVVRASDSGSGDPGSILGRVGVLFP